MNKNMMMSAIIGSAVGSLGGAIFSPDKESVNKNAFLFGTLGAAAGAGTAAAINDKPVDQIKMKQMLLDDVKTKGKEEVPLFDFSPELKDIKPKVEFMPVKKYEVPLEKLPPELEGKVKKQYIIEYESPAQTLKIGTKTIEISPFKAWEHQYAE